MKEIKIKYDRNDRSQKVIKIILERNFNLPDYNKIRLKIGEKLNG